MCRRTSRCTESGGELKKQTTLATFKRHNSPSLPETDRQLLEQIRQMWKKQQT